MQNGIISDGNMVSYVNMRMNFTIIAHCNIIAYVGKSSPENIISTLLIFPNKTRLFYTNLLKWNHFMVFF